MDPDRNPDLLSKLEDIRQIFNDPIYATQALRPESRSLDEEDVKMLVAPVTKTDKNNKHKTQSPKAEDAESRIGPSSESQSQVIENRKLKEEIGWKPEILHQYAIQKPEGYQLEFSDIIPAQVKLREKAKSRAEKRGAASFAIIFYHTFSGPKIDGYSIKIQNEWLRGSLSAIFKHYPDLQLGAPSLEIPAPFEAFIHRWDRLVAAENKEKNHEGKILLKLLREALSVELEDSFQALQNFQTTGYISFDNLPLAFTPGDIIVHSKNDVLEAGILEKAWIQRSPFSGVFSLKVHVVDWDGNNQGLRQEQWFIDDFKGLQRISELEVFPLEAHEGRSRIQAQLLERGKIFTSICGSHMKTFTGHVEIGRGGYPGDYRPGRDSDLIYLSERIIVDAKAYHRFNGPAPPMVPFDGLHESAANMLREAHLRYVSKTGQKLSPEDIQAILAVPKVKGFALDRKSWHKFSISNISSFTWNPEVFENLVLGAGEKTLLSALISHARTTGEEFDDFVQGKGKGLILLLGGPPGVGKTLTAEGISETLQRPLYRVKAGDLGIEASQVERSLKMALDLSAYWDAVLLIDEADVFLGQRTNDDLSRNELVSIFLVQLEYYKGVLILTTNRTEGLDPAFESRIDIILAYNALHRDARREIWTRFIQRLPTSVVDLSGQDLDSLAEWPLNGRQIKSAIKTAKILAGHENVPLRMRHLTIVLNIRRKGAELLRTRAEQQEMLGTHPDQEILPQPFGWLLSLGISIAVVFIAGILAPGL
ncbi:P-loop containing nucleoside triphosphate hydrolase protein [Nemania abortiva]|nr:P-loop containing nucleoside triphosphate hydrolase protein [Nemania abortiva]